MQRHILSGMQPGSACIWFRLSLGSVHTARLFQQLITQPYHIHKGFNLPVPLASNAHSIKQARIYMTSLRKLFAKCTSKWMYGSVALMGVAGIADVGVMRMSTPLSSYPASYSCVSIGRSAASGGPSSTSSSEMEQHDLGFLSNHRLASRSGSSTS